TSTSSRSTRPSPPFRCGRPDSSTCRSTGSTSTVAPWHWVTRSGRPAPVSWSLWSTHCWHAGAESAPPPSVVVAVREMPSSSRSPDMAEPIERNFGLDLVRVTETAALGAARWLGRGDKEAVDQAAVDGMRLHLSTLDIDGVVVIGEGEKDDAPMLFNGEKVGTGVGMVVDVAVDPIDGTTLTASGLPGAISVIAIAEGRGTMYAPGPLVYMDKIAVGPEAAGSIDFEAPIAENLRRIAKARGKDLGELRCLILDRDRNQRHIDEVRQVGARISIFRDGDVAAAIATAEDDEEVDVMLGIGGSPEAVIAAAALKCM